MKMRRRRIILKFKKSKIGKRCKAYDNYCVVCRAWRFYDLHGRFPVSYEEAVSCVVN